MATVSAAATKHRGRLLADCLVADLPGRAGLSRGVRVRCADPRRLADALGWFDESGRESGPRATVVDVDTLLVSDATTSDVAAAAAAGGLTLIELVEVTPSLEEAYLALTESETQYRASVEGRGLAAGAR